MRPVLHLYLKVMIKSMTGYGKAETLLENGKLIVEIRSLNGKNADIGIKSQLIPREKEMEVRQYIAGELTRGNIDLFVNWEQNAKAAARTLNRELFSEYMRQISAAAAQAGAEKETATAPEMIAAIIKIPEVLEQPRQELTGEQWNIFFATIRQAVANLDSFRSREGETLYSDVTKRVRYIESFVDEVEKYEQQRIASIRGRILSKLEEMRVETDENRLEQEIILYIEKLDINEEKVRLRQHCKYFMETINGEAHPGKKLGFIAQEMGREINTMGSKANHAEIQKLVVKMKDELEKIKEQSLNIL